MARSAVRTFLRTRDHTRLIFYVHLCRKAREQMPDTFLVTGLSDDREIGVVEIDEVDILRPWSRERPKALFHTV